MSIPPGYRTITPYPVVKDAPAMIGFLREVFGPSHKVEETFRAVGSAGGYHCEVRIGDCMMMVGGGAPELSWSGESRPMAFHIYVPDIDAAYQRALAAGATSLQEPAEQDWGERTANVKDPFGNNWYIATFRGENYFSEGAPTVQPFLQPISAAPVIEFLESAFGAVESGRATSPDGSILHTTLRIGDAAIELIDAVGIYRPMPGTFFLHVPEVDEVYRRALAAGASSLSEPADQPFGRSGGVEDAAGNKWYIASRPA
jgi:uncharacterized glyoxalase superfamily protein PhnB